MHVRLGNLVLDWDRVIAFHWIDGSWVVSLDHGAGGGPLNIRLEGDELAAMKEAIENIPRAEEKLRPRGERDEPSPF